MKIYICNTYINTLYVFGQVNEILFKQKKINKSNQVHIFRIVITNMSLTAPSTPI